MESSRIFERDRTAVQLAVHDRRRTLDWRLEDAGPMADRAPQTRNRATLLFDGICGDEPHLCIILTTQEGEDPIEKAKRLLDLPIAAEPRIRPPGTKPLTPWGDIHRVRSDTVIGPLPAEWPIGRHITGYSHYLGSYGQGGVGLAGWQLNGGSWMILPLSHAASWMTLTMEETEWMPELSRAVITIDQRIIGVHPDQRQEFPPWEHNYAGREKIDDLPDFSVERPRIARFETSRTGFVLETGGANRIWRFQIADHLPRPVWPGGRWPRDLLESDSLADAFVLAHDCYLDV